MLSIKTLSALLTFSAIGLAAPAPEESNTSTWEDTEFNEVLAKACVNRHQTRDDVLNVWGDVNCVLAAVGSDIDEQRIDKFLRHNFKEIVEDVPESVELNAAPDNVLALLADDNDRITYVSFIGTYLEYLGKGLPPVWPNVGQVHDLYNHAANWAGICDGLSYDKFREYLEFESSRQGKDEDCSLKVSTSAIAPKQTSA